MQFIFNAPATGLVLTVTDLNGRLVMQDGFSGTGSLTRHTLDVEALPAGLYVARITGAGVNGTARFVVE